MRNRDYHKKRAIKDASQIHWERFKKLRNEANIQRRNAKSKFVHDKINDCSRSNDPKEAWQQNTKKSQEILPKQLTKISIHSYAPMREVKMPVRALER